MSRMILWATAIAQVLVKQELRVELSGKWTLLTGPFEELSLWDFFCQMLHKNSKLGQFSSSTQKWVWIIVFIASAALNTAQCNAKTIFEYVGVVKNRSLPKIFGPLPSRFWYCSITLFVFYYSFFSNWKLFNIIVSVFDVCVTFILYTDF